MINNLAESCLGELNLGNFHTLTLPATIILNHFHGISMAFLLLVIQARSFRDSLIQVNVHVYCSLDNYNFELSSKSNACFVKWQHTHSLTIAIFTIFVRSDRDV